jgi:hypothetical protein
VDGFLAAIACANGASGARVWRIPGVNASRARNPCQVPFDAAMLQPSHGRAFFVLPAFAAPWRNGKLVPVNEVRVVWGRGMRSSEYHHRQADLCVRMALTASVSEERIRLLDLANEYRDRASQAAYLWTVQQRQLPAANG